MRIKINAYLEHKSLLTLVFSFLIFCTINLSAIANPSDVSMLEKVYKLDAVTSSGQCPDDLKKVMRASNEDFGCDRARIEYGYRSNELVQCKLRKDLANRIIHEYNTFIEQCSIENNEEN